MKRALLIGINNYTRLAHINYAEQDACAVAEILQNEYHFSNEEIILMTTNRAGIYSPLQNNIEEQLLSLRKLDSLDFLLVGFWGHGVIDSNMKRYLCAQDTITEEERLRKTGISFELFLATLEQVAASETCVLLDCCQNIALDRSNLPLQLTQNDCDLLNQGARDVVTASRKKHSSDKISTTIILNSCSLSQRAFEWEERKHGIFTAHLLDAMKTSPSISQWVQYVSRKVTETANLLGHDQKPFVSINGGSDIKLPGFTKSESEIKINSDNGPTIIISEDPDQVKIKDYQIGDIQINVDKISVTEGEAPKLDQIVLPAIPQNIRELQGEKIGIEKLLSELKLGTASVLVPAQEAIAAAERQRDQIATRWEESWYKLKLSEKDLVSLKKMIHDADPNVSPISLSNSKPPAISMSDFVSQFVWHKKFCQAEETVRRTKEEYASKYQDLIFRLNCRNKKCNEIYNQECLKFYNQVIDRILAICPGYKKSKSPVPFENLTSLLPLLENYHLGWNEDQLWAQAEICWKRYRPCILKIDQDNLFTNRLCALLNITKKIAIFVLILLFIFTVFSVVKTTREQKLKLLEAERVAERQALEQEILVIISDVERFVKQKDYEKASLKTDELFAKSPSDSRGQKLREQINISRGNDLFKEAEKLEENKNHETALAKINQALKFCPSNETYISRQKHLKEEMLRTESFRSAGVRCSLAINNTKFTFCWCPAGTFIMGSPVKEHGLKHSDDETPHEVTLSNGFWMLENETTQEMWMSIMRNNPSIFKGDNLPVEQVSWKDCHQFIEKLQKQSGKTFRLPSEAEWEYACRAGATGIYGEDVGKINEMGWHVSNSDNITHNVKSKKPNAWGLYDMHGNVWEWCEDWYGYDYYSNSPKTDPLNTQSETRRVFRGGSWSSCAHFSRSAFRGCNTPEFRSVCLGFRFITYSLEGTVIPQNEPEKKPNEQEQNSIENVFSPN